MHAETLDEAIAHPERSRLRPHRGPALARLRRARDWLDTSRPATSTSTAASPARSCSASRSAAGSGPRSAPARRRAARTTCSASATGCRSARRAEPPAPARPRAARHRLIEASQSALDYEAFEVLRRSPLRRGRVGRGVRHGEGCLGPRRRAQPVPLPAAARHGPRERVATLADGLRVLAAGLLAKSTLTVSTAHELPKGVRAILAARDIRVVREGERGWLDRAREGRGHGRVRLVGGGPRRSPRRRMARPTSRCGRTR